MPTKQIKLNQVTLCSDGSVGFQFLKQVIDDDGTVLFSEPHRGVIDYDAPDDGHIDAMVKHMKAMGYSVPGAALTRFKRVSSAMTAIANSDPTITAERKAKIATKQKIADDAAAAAAAQLVAAKVDG